MFSGGRARHVAYGDPFQSRMQASRHFRIREPALQLECHPLLKAKHSHFGNLVQGLGEMAVAMTRGANSSKRTRWIGPRSATVVDDEISFPRLGMRGLARLRLEHMVSTHTVGPSSPK